MANCTPTPFDQPRLLIEAMQSLINTQPELTILPGDDVPLVRDRFLTRYELIERLSHYVDLCVLYGESILRHENAQLHGDRDEILRKEMHEDTLMQRISSNMDKLLGHMQRDNRFRKANKKALYPIPRINPRLSPPSSTQEIHNMKNGLKDEGKNIVQIAFLPNQRKAQAEDPEWSCQVKTSPMPQVDLGKKGEGPTCLSTPTPPPPPAMGQYNMHNNTPQTGLLTEL